MTMSTKRDSASINSGNDLKRQKMNNETEMRELARNNMLPSIVSYLPPRDILNCIQTSKKWKEEIDTEYLPSMMLHHRPRDILKCIKASKKWKDKIKTIDTFWEQVANITIPPNFVEGIEEWGRIVHSVNEVKSLSVFDKTKHINWKLFALAFDVDKTGKQVAIDKFLSSANAGDVLAHGRFFFAEFILSLDEDKFEEFCY